MNHDDDQHVLYWLPCNQSDSVISASQAISLSGVFLGRTIIIPFINEQHEAWLGRLTQSHTIFKW